MYDFYNPVWGTDDTTLYVLKGGNQENQPMRVTRIDLSPKTLAAEDTVAHWFEACINRDDDFARSLMKDPSQFMTVSNPHPVAYSITGSGEEKGQSYVEAEETVAYNADSYYVLGKTRFYLVKDQEGYKIDRSVGEQGGVQVYGREGGIYLREGTEGQEKLLLKVEGITPAGAENMHRLSSLAYSPEKRLLIYTVQERKSFTIHVYDQENNKEVFTQEISDGESAVMDISFDGSRNYAAIRYYGASGVGLKLYDVKKRTFLEESLLDNPANAFWAGERLLVEKNGDWGTVRWMFSPETGIFSLGE
jgi:hypothetical protein